MIDFDKRKELAMKVFTWLNKKFNEYLDKKVRKEIERRDKEVAVKIASQIPYGR